LSFSFKPCIFLVCLSPLCTAVDFDRFGTRMVVSSTLDDTPCALMDVGTGSVVRTFDDPAPNVAAISPILSPDDQLVLVRCLANSVHLLFVSGCSRAERDCFCSRNASVVPL
jgi:hypothetical protein